MALKTQVTLTQHYQSRGTNSRGDWTRNDFKTDDGQKFQTFDFKLASRVKSLMGQLIEIEYEPKENGQYVNFEIVDVTPLGGSSPAPAQQAQVQAVASTDSRQEQINRSAGLARAIEFVSVSGESILEAFDNGTLFELALTFARFFETGEIAASSSVAQEAVA